MFTECLLTTVILNNIILPLHGRVQPRVVSDRVYIVFIIPIYSRISLNTGEIFFDLNNT